MKQYLDLLSDVLEAPERGDRTGTGTRSVFGRQLRFVNIAEEFPLVTTKKVYFKGIFHELIWMLRGDTNIKYLVDNNVSIWTDWPLKNYKAQNPDSLMNRYMFEHHIKTDPAFAEKWGDCGPVYGRQWRKWKGKVTKADVDFTHRTIDKMCGVVNLEYEYIDQIANLLHDLRNNPESRRMIVNAWNVTDIPAMIPTGLPPCHLLMQFYTRPLTFVQRRSLALTMSVPQNQQGSGSEQEWSDYYDMFNVPSRYLDCQIYLRSNDLLIGAPFNIAQYALLTHLIAKTVNMVPGELVYTIGDAHLYSNHYEQAKEQITRKPRPLPRLTTDVFPREDPAHYEWEDIKLINYKSHEAIKAPIAV